MAVFFIILAITVFVIFFLGGILSGQKSPKHVGKGSIVTRGHNFKLKIFCLSFLT